MKTKINFNCKVNNCTNEYYAKGFCRAHYNQMKKRGKTLNIFRNDKNEYKILGNTTFISLYNNDLQTIAHAIIDTEDLEKVKDYKWYLTNHNYISTTLKNHKNMLLHRYITNCPNDKVVDHLNHNTLDNRKSNLKICTQKENMSNLKKEPKGICKIKRNNNIYYIVQIKSKYYGCFKNKKDAEYKRNEIINLLKSGRNYL